jgi:hypothetical protein
MAWCRLANCAIDLSQLMPNIAKKQAKKSPHWSGPRNVLCG